MKYIRTIDGIQALYIDEFTEYGKEYYKNCKIADTIEELCDEFVIWFKELDKPTQFRDFETTKQYKKAKVYGAIWTDKGLIYVAKMNDKGELELL